MKWITAIIKPFKFEEVKFALAEVGVEGMTVTEVRGIGRKKAHPEIYRGSEHTVDLLPKIRIEVAVPDVLAARTLDAIVASARTGKIGDGKIFAQPLEEVVRVRTEERGEVAL